MSSNTINGLTTIATDVLIIGSGGAGLFAALHTLQSGPEIDVTIAVKGLLGKSGCTRMVQGGYNVALAKGDSVERPRWAISNIMIHRMICELDLVAIAA